MEEYRSFRFILTSASDLPDVRHLGEMKVYAKVFIISGGRYYSAVETTVDKGGKTNPMWNYEILTSIPEKALQQEGDGKVVILLYCKRSILPNKYVGEVNLSLKKLFDRGLERENVECDVYNRNNARGISGTLEFSYSFGEYTMNKNVEEGSTPTTGQGTKRRISPLKAASAFVHALLDVSQGVEFIQGLLDEEE